MTAAKRTISAYIWHNCAASSRQIPPDRAFSPPKLALATACAPKSPPAHRASPARREHGDRSQGLAQFLNYSKMLGACGRVQATTAKKRQGGRTESRPPARARRVERGNVQFGRSLRTALGPLPNDEPVAMRPLLRLQFGTWSGKPAHAVREDARWDGLRSHRDSAHSVYNEACKNRATRIRKLHP